MDVDSILSPAALESLYCQAIRTGDQDDADAALRLLAAADPDRAEKLLGRARPH